MVKNKLVRGLTKPFQPIGGLLIENYWLQYLLLVVIIVLIVLARASEPLLHPALWVEDGTHVFPYFFYHRDWSALSRTNAGYSTFTVSLVAYLAVRFPLTSIPYIYAWSSFGLHLVASSLFYAQRFRELVVSDLARFFICLFIAASPFAQSHLITVLEYSLRRVPEDRGERIVEGYLP